MENKVLVTEERISHNSAQSIHQCFSTNIFKPDSSVSDKQPLPQSCASIQSIFPTTISKSDSSSISGERLLKFCPSIQSIFPATTSQTSSPANCEIIPYTHPKDSCFPLRCDLDSDSDSFVSSRINIINKYLRSFSIQSCFPPRKSSSSVDSDSSFYFESYPNEQIFETPNLKEFTFADLKTATKNFTPCAVSAAELSLGEESIVTIFKGWMDEKTLSPSTMFVAIKKLSLESMQGCRDYFQNFLGSLSHPNLVELLGYCLKDEQLLLVYELIQNGSLEHLLFSPTNLVKQESLPWDIRLKIAIGAARGLAFLQASKKQVILGDFKSSNILLDRNYNAKISYWDLAKFEPPDFNSSLYPGASKFSATDHLYLKSDAYGFGVVLLEILTGLRKIDTETPNLINWITPYVFNRRKLRTIMDKRIEGQYSSIAALQAARLALRCIESNPRNHLSMKDVVEALERIEAIEKHKKTKIKFYSA